MPTPVAALFRPPPTAPAVAEPAAPAPAALAAPVSPIPPIAAVIAPEIGDTMKLMIGRRISVLNMLTNVSRKLRAKPLPDSNERIRPSVRERLISSFVRFHSSAAFFADSSMTRAVLRRASASGSSWRCRLYISVSASR